MSRILFRMRPAWKYITVIFCFISQYVLSQEISNIRVEQVRDQINIYYDLSDVDTDQILRVELFLSDDGGESFSISPKSIFGDVGTGVTPGENKKIIWDVLKDYDEITGEAFQFKLVADYLTSEAKSIPPRNRYLGTGPGYARYDNENTYVICLQHCWRFGRFGIGAELNGFLSRSAYPQFEHRLFYGYQGGFLFEPRLLNSHNFVIYTPLSFGVGQIVEKFQDESMSAGLPKSTLFMGYLDPGIGFGIRLRNNSSVAFELRYLVTNMLEFYDPFFLSRRLKGFSVCTVIKFGAFHP